MGAINVKNGNLYFDFRYMGIRCREYTKLTDTQQNRKRMTLLLKRIEAEIITGIFSYSQYFPNSRMVEKFASLNQKKHASEQFHEAVKSPRFEEFSETWLAEKKIEWRIGYYIDVEGVLNNHILPKFGKKKIDVVN